MKTKSLCVAVAVIALSSFASQAQTTSDVNQATTTQSRIRHIDRRSAFDGINLTEAQREALDSMKTTHRQKVAKDKKDAREAKRQRRQATRRNYLNDVKAILTPEQYVQFLENSFARNSNIHSRDGKKNHRHNMSRQHKAGRSKSDRLRKSMKTDKAAQANGAQVAKTN